MCWSCRLKQTRICFSKGDYVKWSIRVSLCCLWDISKTCSLNQPLFNKLMILHVCILGWAQVSCSSDPGWGWLISVGFPHESVLSGWVSCGLSGLWWPRQGQLRPLPVVSQPGPYPDKTSIPFPFTFNLSMSLHSFCNLFILCHVSPFPRVTSLNLVAWIFLRQGVERANISSDLFLITFRVIIFIYFMAISPKCVQEGAVVQTKLIDWLIR